MNLARVEGHAINSLPRRRLIQAFKQVSVDEIKDEMTRSAMIAILDRLGPARDYEARSDWALRGDLLYLKQRPPNK